MLVKCPFTFSALFFSTAHAYFSTLVMSVSPNWNVSSMMEWILGLGCLSSFVVVVLPSAFRMCRDIGDAPPKKFVERLKLPHD